MEAVDWPLQSTSSCAVSCPAGCTLVGTDEVRSLHRTKSTGRAIWTRRRSRWPPTSSRRRRHCAD
eukprot:5141564-Prymnesium_polylepis.1